MTWLVGLGRHGLAGTGLWWERRAAQPLGNGGAGLGRISWTGNIKKRLVTCLEQREEGGVGWWFSCATYFALSISGTDAGTN